jgi:hypothetical protein
MKGSNSFTINQALVSASNKTLGVGGTGAEKPLRSGFHSYQVLLDPGKIKQHSPVESSQYKTTRKKATHQQ